LDGNGRMGRLLITFYLYWRGVLLKPLLYLSFYLKKHRDEYYTILNKTRFEGDWESWLEFFFKGVIEVSNNSIDTAKKVIKLKQDLIEKLLENNISGVHAVKLIDGLFDRPVITVTEVSEYVGMSRQAANTLVKKFENAEILREITGRKRYKKYIFSDYVRIIEKGTHN
jgi:Fic family protein